MAVRAVAVAIYVLAPSAQLGVRGSTRVLRPIASENATKCVLAMWRRVNGRHGMCSCLPKCYDTPLPNPVSIPFLTIVMM